jgi:hypothetical protein
MVTPQTARAWSRQGSAGKNRHFDRHFRWGNSMKFRMIVCALCCAMLVSGLVSGCSEINTGHETDLAKLPPPPSASAKPASKSFSSNKKNQLLAKQLAKRSSPPIVHQ